MERAEEGRECGDCQIPRPEREKLLIARNSSKRSGAVGTRKESCCLIKHDRETIRSIISFLVFLLS
jgi:hypothetical protein